MLDRLRGVVYRTSFLTLKNLTLLNMKKEIRQDLCTQAFYAKKVGLTPARVNQMVKNGDIKTVVINGATLIKI